METKVLPLSIKALADDGTYEGYAAAIGNIDLANDVILPGAFSATLSDFAERGAVLWQHHSDEPICVAGETTEDAHGLHVTGRFVLDTQKGREAYALAKAGAIKGLSIGFQAKSYETMKGDACDPYMGAGVTDAQREAIRAQGIRALSAVDLWEYSFVTFPANLEARLSSVKGTTGYTKVPLAARGRAWDASAAEGRVRSWAGADDVPNAKYGRAFLWHDTTEGDADDFEDYKLPYCDVIGGELTAIPRAIFAVAARLKGTDIPDADKATVRATVTKWYARMRDEFDDDSIVAPWDAGKSAGGRSPADQTLAEESQAVLATVDGLIVRLTELKALRQREGRPLSKVAIAHAEDLKERLLAAQCAVDGLLARPADPAAIMAELARSELLRSRDLGVTV